VNAGRTVEALFGLVECGRRRQQEADQEDHLDSLKLPDAGCDAFSYVRDLYEPGGFVSVVAWN
jgi:hypothetical protein